MRSHCTRLHERSRERKYEKNQKDKEEGDNVQLQRYRYRAAIDSREGNFLGNRIGESLSSLSLESELEERGREENSFRGGEWCRPAMDFVPN